MSRRQRLGRRVPMLSLVAGVLCVAAVAVVAGLAARPAPASSPSPSAPPPLDAGIAHVDSVSGRLILDAPSSNPSSFSRMAWTGFAATSAGDRRADVHYAVDWDAAAASYRKELRDLVRRKSELGDQYASQLEDLRRTSAVTTRNVWVQDAARRIATLALFSSDPITRRPSRVRYITMPYAVGLPPTPDRTQSWRVWELATQLQSAIETGQGIRVADETRDGASVYRVDVPAAGDEPAWSAFVDQATGLTLSVTGSASGDRGVSSPYHVEDLRVNGPLGPYAFVVRPDYRKVPGVRGGPEVKTLDISGGSSMEHWLPPDQLGAVAPPSLLVPRAPAGFVLSELRVFGPPKSTEWVALIYRRGLSMIYTWSGRRRPEYVVSDDGDEVSRPDHVPAFDRQVWPELGGSWHTVDAITRVAGGVFAGEPAALGGAPGSTTLVEAWDARDEALLSGDATRGQLLAMAGSLRPLRAGVWRSPVTGLLALVAVLTAATLALATVWVWTARHQAPSPEPRPLLAPLAWPLAGLVVLFAGMCLDWHALHTGLVWGVRGWGEPLGRWVLAAGLGAVVCAAWVQLGRTPRRRQAARAGALFLSAAALAGAASAFAYLPAIARFTVDPGIRQGITSESWLVRTLGSANSPSAAAGLYVSAAGALLLFVGVLLLRRRTAEAAAPEMAAGPPGAPPEAADASGAPPFTTGDEPAAG